MKKHLFIKFKTEISRDAVAEKLSGEGLEWPEFETKVQGWAMDKPMVFVRVLGASPDREATAAGNEAAERDQAAERERDQAAEREAGVKRKQTATREQVEREQAIARKGEVDAERVKEYLLRRKKLLRRIRERAEQEQGQQTA